MLAFGQKWTWSCDQCWHLQTDKTRISDNGAMKARAKSVYFEPGCEKLACETFKSLDSCAARPKENESYVSFLSQSNRQRQIRKGGRSWVLAKKKRSQCFQLNLFVLNRCCNRFINPSNQSLTEVMHWLTVQVVTVTKLFFSLPNIFFLFLFLFPFLFLCLFLFPSFSLFLPLF